MYLVVRLFFIMLIGAVLEVVGVGAIPAFVTFLSRPDIVLSHPIGERLFEW